MKRHNFTLVELLSTIAIIVILAGILIPAVNSAVKKGESAKAKAEITALVNAIKQYENTYNKLPIMNGIDTISFTTDIDEGSSKKTITIYYAEGRKLPSNLVRALQGDKSIVLSGTKKANPRGIKFLDINNAGKGEYDDPWEKGYRIILANDEEISLNALANRDSDDNDESYKKKRNKYDSQGMIYQSVVVWSAGPDGEWDTKDDVHSFNAEYDAGKWKLTN